MPRLAVYPANAETNKLSDVLPDEILSTLARLVHELRFGSIEIVVHDGRITQIERREKVRFSQTPSQPS
jgi:hypothetical protein